MFSPGNINYILVTGATGFVGAHVVDSLLRRGLRVRATTRSLSKGQRMIQDRPDYASKLDFIQIGDITHPGCFDSAVTGGIDGVIHCASPATLKYEDNENDVIIPAITGTTSILSAAARMPEIQRVVITSSFAAVVDSDATHEPGFIYTSAHWNPLTYEDGVNGNSLQAYRVSKKLSEKAAWDFVAEKKPAFDLATIQAPIVFGPPAHVITSLTQLNSSSSYIWQVACGTYPEQRMLIPQCVDVREVAEAHAKALLNPEAGGKRFLVAGPKWSFAKIVDIITKEFDWAKERVKPLDREDIITTFGIDGETAAKELGLQYRPLEQTIVDSFKALKEIEDKEAEEKGGEEKRVV
ncbi:NAD(P)-binding protein [Wilcoxina mikolae CBS 423.85]|nr:NAD(P)-binding protein [Wilcoxina mikolae CBS 423.85]